MELFTNNALIISLNVFAVCLWAVTIVMMFKRRLVSVRGNVIEKKNKNQENFKETLTKKIKNQDLKMNEAIIKIKPELRDVNKLYSKRFKSGENIKNNIYKTKEENFFDYIKKNQNKMDTKHINREHKNIISMAKEGLTPFEIAKRMNKSMGEIELVMKISQHLH